MSAEFDQAAAELSRQLDAKLAGFKQDIAEIKAQVGFIYRSELIPDGSGGTYPFTKSGANFDDVRALTNKLQWLVDNETIPVDDKDPAKGSYPFTKTATIFNDLRALAAKLSKA